MSHNGKCWKEREPLNVVLDGRTHSTAEIIRDGDQGYQMFPWLKRSQQSPRDERSTQFCHESAYHVDSCLTPQKECRPGSSSKYKQQEHISLKHKCKY